LRRSPPVLRVNCLTGGATATSMPNFNEAGNDSVGAPRP